MKEIKMFTRTTCSKCRIKKAELAEKGVVVAEVDIDTDQVAFNRLVNEGHRSLPVFEVDGALVTEYTP